MKLKQFDAASEPLTRRECDSERHPIGHSNDVGSPCAMRLALRLTMGHAFAERQRRGVIEAVAATAFEPFGQVIEASGDAAPVADHHVFCNSLCDVGSAAPMMNSGQPL